MYIMKEGFAMKLTLSKWGNSLAVRIPAKTIDSLKLEAGDKIELQLKDGGMFLKKEESTIDIFEKFYGKPFSEITLDDIGPAKEIDWGEDVGGEVL